MATVADLITETRRRLQDSTDASYSDAEITQYIIDGQRDFSIIGCCRSRQSKSMSAASTLAFSTIITSSMKNIVEIVRIDAGSEPLTRATVYEELAWPTSGNTSAPEGWAEWDDIAYFDSTWTGTANVWFTYVPADDVIGVPDQWTQAVVAFACYKCLDSSQDQQAQALLAEYQTQKTQAAVMYGYLENKPRPTAG